MMAWKPAKRPRKTKKRPLRCRSDEQRFTVLQINNDPSDSHAARSFEQALRLAQPDRGARVDVFRVCASDAGAARNMHIVGKLVKTFRYKGR